MTTTATRPRTRAKVAAPAPAAEEHRCCASCGCHLAENLRGHLYCPLQRCPLYQQTVEKLPRNVGTIPADLTSEPAT